MFANIIVSNELAPPKPSMVDSLKIWPRKFQRTLEILVLLILDAADEPDQPFRFFLCFFLEDAPVRHDDVSIRRYAAGSRLSGGLAAGRTA